MARSTDCIGAPNVLASSRAPAQADIEIIDVISTNNVLIGNPWGFREVMSQFACRMRRNYGETDLVARRRARPSAYGSRGQCPLWVISDIGRSEVVPPPCQSEHEPRHRDRAHPPGTHRSNFRF